MNQLLRSSSSAAFYIRRHAAVPIDASLSCLLSKTTSIRCLSTTTPNDDKVFQRTVYVHPLSHIILEHFQATRSDWVYQKGLERSLVLHRDGTFELKFPNSEENNRIWTSYDEREKKHWLTVQKGPLHERFLLQDNLASTWHANRRSLPERIQVTVDEMICAIDRMDGLEQDQRNDGDYPK